MEKILKTIKKKSLDERTLVSYSEVKGSDETLIYFDSPNAKKGPEHTLFGSELFFENFGHIVYRSAIKTAVNKKLNVIHVTDVTNSFFNSIDIDFIKSFINTDIVYTMGECFGGFNSIMFTNFYPVNKCFTVGPLFSGLEKYVNNLKISRQFFNNGLIYADEIKYEHLEFSKNTHYKILLGKNDYYMNIYNQIPKLDNIEFEFIKPDENDKETREIQCQLLDSGYYYDAVNKYFWNND